jgi:hypothetical protein
MQFINSYMVFHNYTFPWWYSFVTMCLLAPGVVGICLFIGWFTLDCERTRGNLTCANILQLISFVLVLLWHVFYLTLIYKGDTVATGFGEDTKTYTWSSKKHKVYFELAWGVAGVAFYIVALTAIRSYVNAMKNTEKTELTPYEYEQQKKAGKQN